MTGGDRRNDPDETTGSPASGEPVFLVVGKFHRPHGVRGEIGMEVYTDFPERLRKGTAIYVGDERLKLRIHSARQADDSLLVGLDGYATPEAVGALRNQLVWVRAEDIPPLPAGEYYHHQIIGLRVLAESGEDLGQVTGMLETGANDVCTVRTAQGKEWLLPMVDSFLLEINVPAGTLRVRVQEGLLPD
ncbi:MAG: ribosome maturation factor RimM [Chloroflexi bacterium]|nr:ribosome maturation factor RimM [Chloroflexota bacterium]